MIVADLYEFLFSLFIISGSGFLLYKGIAPELASGTILLVTGSWFQKKAGEASVTNLLKNVPAIPPEIPAIPAPAIVTPSGV